MYKSKITVVSLFLTVSAIAAALLINWLGTDYLREGRYVGGLFTTAFGVLVFCGALLGLTNRVEVNLTAVTQRDIFKRRSVQWKDVKELHLDSNSYGGYNVIVTVRNQKNFILFSAYAGKSRELTKAIIEAATTANSSIRLKGFWADVFGRPPYGIFADATSK